MSVAAGPLPALENTFAAELEGLYVPWKAAEGPEPRLLALNEDLASELGLDPDVLGSPEGVAALVGAAVPEGATPIAQAYAGHQFGALSPRLGDGRALLLGELVDVHGRRRDLHLKGSGRTPFARGGDGKAAVGPMLRELVVGEAMHALGIPTTRALAVVATGEPVVREAVLPGAVLVRVAASHLRVGTFEYAALQRDRGLLTRLADYAIRRHHPEAAEAANPYLALLERVVEAQASLVARWMLVGFIHGVMNTDNMTISGETIDYGPCAFMEAFDPGTVFSSIDHGGRYAYGDQPAIAQWNLARLAEALLPLIAEDADTAVAQATEVLATFPDRYDEHFGAGLQSKLGGAADDALARELLETLQAERLDMTSTFRTLAAVLRGDALPPAPLAAWVTRWKAALPDRAAAAVAMDQANPVYVPRNHLVEDALAAATAGDLGPLERLLDAVRRPFDERPGLEGYASPAPDAFAASFRTFCGT